MTRALKEHLAIFFDGAPCMMHCIDRRGRLVKVNRRWLEVMGYDGAEVLGRNVADFLTEPCRRKAEEEMIPALWVHGFARQVEYQFVTQSDRIIDVSLDGEVAVDSRGNRFGLGVIRVDTQSAYSSEDIVAKAFIEPVQDMALSLRAIARAQEERLETQTEQMQELILAVNYIQRNVRDLTILLG